MSMTNQKGYTAEVVHTVYDDDTGEHISVGPDADTGDLLELRHIEPDGKIVARIGGYPEQMRLVAKALLALTEKPA